MQMETTSNGKKILKIVKLTEKFARQKQAKSENRADT